MFVKLFKNVQEASEIETVYGLVKLYVNMQIVPHTYVMLTE